MYRSAANATPTGWRDMAIAVTTLAILVCSSLSSQARAETYKVCNATADRMLISIVYSVGDARNYISNGWWSLAPHGGCATVLDRPLPIKGVFLRGEASGKVWEGKSLFCVLPHGELPNANNLDRPACAARGGQMKAYEMHVIKSAALTTTLRTPGSATASGRAPQHAGGFGNDVHGCAADAPCFQEVFQTGNQIVFKFNGVQGFDFYNVRFDNGQQFENRSGTYTLSNVKPHHTYRISVQGCQSHMLAHSSCSGWVAQTFTAR